MRAASLFLLSQLLSVGLPLVLVPSAPLTLQPHGSRCCDSATTITSAAVLHSPTRGAVAAARCQLGSGGNSLPPSPEPQKAGGGLVRDIKGLWGQLVANPSTDASQQQLALDLGSDQATDDLEYVPLVLVVGATGRMGRIIVRKLVLQGFRVAVLVRSLSTETLNLLGSGVSYSYGDMTDYRSLLDAMEDVDRVIFAAESDEQQELLGLSQVMRSFQDTRTFMYGEAEATKLTLHKMRRDRDFGQWAIETSSDDVADRLASAGIGPAPTVAYWKRSPTGAHRNGVFVGKVFDTYLGSAVVSCSLSGLLIGGAPVLEAGAESGQLSSGANAQLAASLLGSDSAAAPSSSPAASDGGGGLQAEQQVDREVAAKVAAKVPLNLAEYSGLVLRAIGDGNKYTVVLRTPEYARSGIEYQLDFTSTTKTFDTVRLPFSRFVGVRNGRRVANAPELDRRNLVGLGLGFYPQRNQPSQTTGEFYLSLANVKAYRKRDEPELVYISDAAVESAAYHDADVENAEVRRARAKRKGEEMVKRSGLTYFIVRAAELTDEPSSRRLSFTQGGGIDKGSVSRADVAEVAVRSLLDPRACNLACTVTQSDAIAPSSFEQDISKALEVLEPNR